MASEVVSAAQTATALLPTSYIPDALDAYRLTIGTYFTVGSLSVFVWDILFNLEHDYQLLRMHHARIPSVIYFVSRFSTLAFSIMETILLTVPVENCRSYQIATIFFYNLFIASTMLLSYFRVCAIWNRDRHIKWLFGFLWFVGFCGSLTSAAGVVSSHMNGSPYCTQSVAHGFAAAAVLGPMLNHLAVFVAITYGVCKTCADNHEKLTIKAGYRVFVLGESLPTFSKAILQTCQLCYLAATLSGVASVIWFYVFASSPSYRLATFVPYAVIVNIMFSWVFRKAKLGMCAASNFAGPAAVCPSTLAKNADPCTADLDRIPSPTNSMTDSLPPMEIGVEKVVEYELDYPRDEKRDTIDILSFTV